MGSKINPVVRRDGLTILRDPGDDTELDLVIVHGLNGHPFRTFFNEPTGFYWPSHLAGTLPTARIMVFGYHADISGGLSNTLGTYQHAESLLLHLKNNRIGVERRPVVLLGHSLGGVVIKQAIVTSSHRPADDHILQSTKLIVFLGTPHRGSHMLDKAVVKAGLSFMRVASRAMPKSVKPMLQPRADESFILNTEFMRVKDRIEIVNFYEQVSRHSLQDLVVDKDSAVFDSELSENIPVPRDHQALVRFTGAHDDAYRTLRETIYRKVTRFLKEMANSTRDEYSKRMRSACLQSLGDFTTNTGLSQSKEAHEKTLSWLWHGDSEFSHWILSGSGLFAVTGKPGSGKSVLMNEIATGMRRRYSHRFSVIVQHAFNARGAPREHSFDGFLRSAIGHILSHCPSAFDTSVIDEWRLMSYSSGFHDKQEGDDDASSIVWPLSSLKRVLRLVTANAARELPLCFIIDALDECDGGAEITHQLITFLNDMSSDPLIDGSSTGDIRICFSCRGVPGSVESTTNGGLKMEHQNGPDIAAYVNDRWTVLESMLGVGNGLKQLKTELIQKADGIFLWAHLVMERIQTALRDGATVAELREVIKEIPDELGGLFGLLLGNINPKFADETNTMLAIALSARRPMTLVEFRYATALAGATSQTISSQRGLEQFQNFVRDDETMTRRIRSRCGGLLEVRDSSQSLSNAEYVILGRVELVQFIHQSVRDSLLASLKPLPEPNEGHGVTNNTLIASGNDTLARCCLDYFALKEVRELANYIRTSGLDMRSKLKVIQDLPFLRYAIMFSLDHCQDAEESGIPQAEIISRHFENGDEKALQNLLILRKALDPRLPQWSMGLDLLQLAVDYNISSYVNERLRHDSSNVNEALDLGQTYLQLAVWSENIATVKVLLAHGADANLVYLHWSQLTDVRYDRTDFKFHRPLETACEIGNVKMVQALLEGGADVSCCVGFYTGYHANYALMKAAYSGNIEVVRLLLDSHPAAFTHPHVRISAIIILGDAIRQHRSRPAPIRSTIPATDLRNRFENMRRDTDVENFWQISDLILAGTDIYEVDFENLSAAVFWYFTGCDIKVLQQLINIGTDLNLRRNRDGVFLLLVACLHGTLTSVQLLLQKGVDPHGTLTQSSYLHYAILNKSPTILAHLLEQGLSIDVQDFYGRTPLHLAAKEATDEFIDQLLRHNADKTIPDCMGHRVLHFAVTNCHLKDTVSMLEKLLCQEDDISLPNNDRLTPLHMAASEGALVAVAWLLSKGADPTATDGADRTPLHFAASSTNTDSTDVLSLLLSNSQLSQQRPTSATHPNVNTRDCASQTLLHHVFWSHHVFLAEPPFDPAVAMSKAKLLLHHGADLNATDNVGNTPLHRAAARGMKDAVELFLSLGADPEIQDINQLRPLDVAQDEGVRELLEGAVQSGAGGVRVYHAGGSMGA